MSRIADAVIHASDYSAGNRPESLSLREWEQVQKAHVLNHQTWAHPDYICPSEFHNDAFDAEAVAHAVFYESETDVAVYHDVPLTAVFKNGGSPIEVGAEIARALPGRVLLYGGVDALAPTPAALERMDHLVEEFDVAGFKFYPMTGIFDHQTGQTTGGWLMDDENRMFPLLKHAEELGVPHVAVHKAIPFGFESMEPFLNVHDLDAAAAVFPNVTFEVVHSGMAFLEETAWQLRRHPNIYANLEVTMNLVVRWPRKFARIFGTLLEFGGPSRILHSTGAVLHHPQPVIDAFRGFEMPPDLVEEGCAEVTDEVKEMVLGGNLLKLHGITETELQRTIDHDDVARARRERGLAPPWSRRPRVAA